MSVLPYALTRVQEGLTMSSVETSVTSPDSGHKNVVPWLAVK